MNIVFAFVIAGVIYLVGLPVPVNPSIIGYVEPNSPEAKLGIQAGDKIVEVNGKAVKSWQDVQMTAALARTNVMPVVIVRDGVSKTYILTAKNNEQLGLKVLNLDPQDHPQILQILSGTPADKFEIHMAEFRTFVTDTMLEFVRRCPDGAVLTIESLMRTVTPICTMAIALGLHVRVGVEDNLWRRKGERITSVQQVEQMVRIARELNREVATGEEAKRIYQIGTYWKDADEALAKLGWPPNRRPGQRGFPIPGSAPAVAAQPGSAPRKSKIAA